jgi:arginase family enzyme
MWAAPMSPSWVCRSTLGSATGGSRLVAIGGDHTIARPLLCTVARIHGPLAVIHFGADVVEVSPPHDHA